jgi:succinate dehydrogenase / fumarate reductase cytochrome b subunit
MAERPLSPHLGVYRFAYTMALSITHRIAGVAMALGLAAMACWLMAAADGAAAYARLMSTYSHWLFRLLLVGWLLAFLFHFANGIRHLLWDAGAGLEKAQARRSATLVIVVVAAAFGFCLWRVAVRSAGAP